MLLRKNMINRSSVRRLSEMWGSGRDQRNVFELSLYVVQDKKVFFSHWLVLNFDCVLPRDDYGRSLTSWSGFGCGSISLTLILSLKMNNYYHWSHDAMALYGIHDRKIGLLTNSVADSYQQIDLEQTHSFSRLNKKQMRVLIMLVNDCLGRISLCLHV